MTFRTSWLAKLTILLASLILTFGLGEVVARFALARNQAAARDARAALEAEAGPLPVMRSVLEIRKNRRGIYKGALVRTNAQGLRGPQHSSTPAAGTTRVVVAGDSFTFGSGVAESDVYASQLGPLLDRGRPARRHEVINAGRPGAHIGGVMDWLEKAIVAYRPGLYVYGLTLNDIEGPRYEMLAADASARSWVTWSALHPSRLVQLVGWRLATLAVSGSPADERYPRELWRNYFENAASWGWLEGQLDRFAKMAAANGVCGHLLIHTQLTNLDASHPFHPIYERVADAARERGLTVSQPFSHFEGRDPRSLWISPIDPHPNAEGHQVLAETLAEDLLALPERCWQQAARGQGPQSPTRRGR